MQYTHCLGVFVVVTALIRQWLRWAVAIQYTYYYSHKSIVSLHGNNSAISTGIFLMLFVGPLSFKIEYGMPNLIILNQSGFHSLRQKSFQCLTAAPTALRGGWLEGRATRLLAKESNVHIHDLALERIAAGGVTLDDVQLQAVVPVHAGYSIVLKQ